MMGKWIGIDCRKPTKSTTTKHPTDQPKVPNVSPAEKGNPKHSNAQIWTGHRSPHWFVFVFVIVFVFVFELRSRPATHRFWSPISCSRTKWEKSISGSFMAFPISPFVFERPPQTRGGIRFLRFKSFRRLPRNWFGVLPTFSKSSEADSFSERQINQSQLLNTQIQIHKYTNTQIQIHKSKSIDPNFLKNLLWEANPSASKNTKDCCPCKCSQLWIL